MTEQNMPEQVIMVEEKRGFIEKAKNKMAKLRQTYDEKMIQTGKSQKLEEKIEKRAKRKKKMIKTLGAIATVALAICPADGPFGEIAAALATPGLCELVDISAEIEKKALITSKRTAEKYILKVDGKNENVAGYDITNGDVVEDIKSLKEAIANVEVQSNTMGKKAA